LNLSFDAVRSARFELLMDDLICEPNHIASIAIVLRESDFLPVTYPGRLDHSRCMLHAIEYGRAQILQRMIVVGVGVRRSARGWGRLDA
jgi:hypothetical protein